MSRKRDNSPKKRQTKNRLTSNQREWKHQVTNLKRRIKDLQGLGVEVAYDIPEMPKTVRKRDIDKIKNIKREQLLKFAFTVYAFGEIGEAFIPKIGERAEYRRHIKEAREQERQAELARQEAEEFRREKDRMLADLYDEPVDIVDVELQNLRSFIEGYTNPTANQWTLKGAKHDLLEMLDMAIEAYGRREVATRAENVANARDFAKQAMDESNSDAQRQSLNGFSQALFGRSFTLAELYAVQQNIESYEDFEEE